MKTYKVVTEFTGEGEKFLESIAEMKKQINSGEFQRELQENNSIKKVTATFEELK